MSSELGQFLFSLGVTSGLMAVIWFVTRFQIPEPLEVDLPNPKKEAAIAVGYVIGLFLLIAGALFVLQPEVSGSTRVPRQFDLGEGLRQWTIYVVISLVPVSVLIRFRKQSFETVGVTSKNLSICCSLTIIGCSSWLVRSKFNPHTQRARKKLMC